MPRCPSRWATFSPSGRWVWRNATCHNAACHNAACHNTSVLPMELAGSFLACAHCCLSTWLRPLLPLHTAGITSASSRGSTHCCATHVTMQVLARYHPMALRWFLITTHYRAPVSFSTQALDEASARLFYVYQTLLDAHDALAAAGVLRVCMHIARANACGRRGDWCGQCLYSRPMTVMVRMHPHWSQHGTASTNV